MSKQSPQSARRAIEVSFGERYVLRPESMHGTNTLKLGRDVDTIELTSWGVLVTKTVDNKERGAPAKRFQSLYPWALVGTVKYEPEELEPTKTDGFADEPAKIPDFKIVDQ